MKSKKLTTEIFGPITKNDFVKAYFEVWHDSNPVAKFEDFILTSAPLQIKSYTQYIESLDQIFAQTTGYAAQLYGFAFAIPQSDATKKASEFEKFFVEKMVIYNLPRKGFVKLITKYDVYKILPLNLTRNIQDSLFVYQMEALLLEHVILANSAVQIYNKTGQSEETAAPEVDMAAHKLPTGGMA